MKRALLLALSSLVLMAAASDPSERLSDPAQEGRARAVFRQIRCVVCQNESIDDSEAGLAHDLRQIIREQVREGRSDGDIKRFLVTRYGQFILLRPSFSWPNATLWLTPLVIFLGAGAFLAFKARRPAPPDAPLSERERADLAAIGAGSARHGFAATALQEKRDDDRPST